MSQIKDIQGKRFGRWLVLQRTGSDKRGESLWRCRCDCGNEAILIGGSLRTGNSVSCGCFKKENPPRKVHGASGTKMYGRWKGMIRRCENKKTRAYKDYGGRGISVCERWRNSFEAFVVDMGPCPDGYSLERKNNNGNYEPSNCIWVPSDIQANNNRRNRILVCNGESKTMAEWSKITEIKIGTIWKRLKTGWSDEEAILTPTTIEEV